MSKAKEDREALRDGESFPVYTGTELAVMLGVQLDTLRKWRVAGTGPKFIRESRNSVVYLKTSVMAWLKKRERRVQVSYPRKRATPAATKRKKNVVAFKRTTRADQSSDAESPGA